MTESPCGLGQRCTTDFRRASEERAVRALAESLAEAGRSVVLRCVPDGSHCPWTMDAVVSIDGLTWVIDHTRLTWSSQTVPWIQEADRDLRRALEPIARNLNGHIAADCPRICGGSRSDRKSRLKAVRLFVEQACAELRGGQLAWLEWRVGPDDMRVQFIPVAANAAASDVPRVTLSFAMSEQPSLVEQFADVNWPTIQAKIYGQLAPRSGVYDHAGLILDQTDEVGGRWPTANWNLTPTAIQQALMTLMPADPGRFAAVWLFTALHGVQLVWPGGETSAADA